MAISEKSRPPGALSGIKVLDLSRVLAGPWASQLLADYGADVIKVERPDSGDDTRSWGPPWLNRQVPGDRADSAYFLSTNRNKRSVTINIANAAGQDLVRRLATRCDVVLENFKVGVLEKFGLDYATLSDLNPRLIFCSISAYGQTGSRAHLPGYDAMIQASAGLMSITGPSDDDNGSPQKVGVAIADVMAGMYSATAILAALAARGKNGKGQYIDIALYDSQVAWLANQNMNYLIGGVTPERAGTAHPNIVPYQAFSTQDGDIMLAVGNDRQFQRLSKCLGLENLPADPRFADNASRVANRGELIPILADTFATQRQEYWLSRLGEYGVPAGPINDIATVLSEPYAKERQLVRDVEDAQGDVIPTVANPVRFSETPVTYGLAPPALGEHTDEVLRHDLGLSEADIRALSKANAI